MKLMCNIDIYGRLLRGATGLVLLGNGLLMLVWSVPGAGLGSRVLQGAMIVLGAFCIFEAIVGWCAIRAMGYKTRI